MLWIKAFHIIAVVCWFAALFYLPRLFVYHAQTQDQAGNERFKIMERKLYRGIATPSMIATVVLGFWLASYQWSHYLSAGWFHAKVFLVLLLVVYHFVCQVHLRAFQEDRNHRSHRYFRIFNELPVLALITIIILVEVQPF